MSGSSGRAASGSIVLGTLPEKNNLSHAAIKCLNLLLLDFTTYLVQMRTKMAFPIKSDGQKEEEERVVWWHGQWIDCT